jgi:O-antigen/teichoic acid export membrane protein
LDKALQMGKSSTAGSFYLLIGVVASTVIMALGTLVLAGLLSVDEVGLYGIALIPATIINYFRDLGVNSAMTQQIASLRAAGKETEIHDVIVSGMFFEIIVGAVLALVCFAIAQPLAVILSPSNAASLTVLIAIMSISVFAGGILNASASIFVGFERMKLNSFTQILQAIVKTSLGPLLIVLGFGVFGAIYAAMGSILAGGVIAILIVYLTLFRQLRKDKVGKIEIKRTLIPMLKYGVPLTVSGIMVGVLPQIFAFMMAVNVGEWWMGNYYAATYFGVLISFISFPISTALFPAFAKLNPEHEPELVRTVFASSVKYTAMLLVPMSLLIMTLSTPIVNTLFPQNGILQSLFTVGAEAKFPYAPIFLTLSCAVNFLVLFGNVSLSTFQTGIGKTSQIMKQSALSLAIGLPFAYFIISYFNVLGGSYLAVIGGIVAILVSSIPGIIWGLIWLWKNYKIKADFKSSAKILAASVIASATTYALLLFINLPYVFMLIAGFLVFLAVYLATAPLLGAVNRADIDNLKEMTSGLGIISKALGFPLLFMRKICKEPQSSSKLMAKELEA